MKIYFEDIKKLNVFRNTPGIWSIHILGVNIFVDV